MDPRWTVSSTRKGHEFQEGDSSSQDVLVRLNFRERKDHFDIDMAF